MYHLSEISHLQRCNRTELKIVNLPLNLSLQGISEEFGVFALRFLGFHNLDRNWHFLYNDASLFPNVVRDVAINRCCNGFDCFIWHVDNCGYHVSRLNLLVLRDLCDLAKDALSDVWHNLLIEKLHFQVMIELFKDVFHRVFTHLCAILVDLYEWCCHTFHLYRKQSILFIDN